MTKAWLLPDVVDPVETVCVQIEVPKDDAHIQAFFGAIQQLGLWWNWERDESQTALATSIVWQRQLALAAQKVRVGDNCMVDCNDIEGCLDTSTIINNIIIDIDINETNITNNETNITNNTTNITNNETNIDIIIEGGIDINVYPPAPTQEEADELCGASFYIANQLNDHIQDIIADALVLTFQEFVEGLLGIGGFQASWVKLWWDFIIVVGNPTLGTEVSDTIAAVAEHLYCNDLDRDLVETAIDTDSGITDDAQAAWIGALRSITDAKLNLWAFVGSQDDSNDCSSFACTCGTPLRFYPGDAGVTMLQGSDQGTHWLSVDDGSHADVIELRTTWAGCSVNHVRVKAKAIHISGGDNANRNASHYLNGGLLSFAPYDEMVDDVWMVTGEDISPFGGPSLDWKLRIGWAGSNDWKLHIEYIELVTTP